MGRVGGWQLLSDRDPLLDAQEAYDQACREDEAVELERKAVTKGWSTTTEYFDQQIKLLTEKARKIIRRAEDDGGEMFADEKAEVEEILANVGDLKIRRQMTKDDERLLAAMEEMTG